MDQPKGPFLCRADCLRRTPAPRPGQCVTSRTWCITRTRSAQRQCPRRSMWQQPSKIPARPPASQPRAGGVSAPRGHAGPDGVGGERGWQRGGGDPGTTGLLVGEGSGIRHPSKSGHCVPRSSRLCPLFFTTLTPPSEERPSLRLSRRWTPRSWSSIEQLLFRWCAKCSPPLPSGRIPMPAPRGLQAWGEDTGSLPAEENEDPWASGCSREPLF